jgi:hypothetical protein
MSSFNNSTQPPSSSKTIIGTTLTNPIMTLDSHICDPNVCVHDTSNPADLTDHHCHYDSCPLDDPYRFGTENWYDKKWEK